MPDERPLVGHRYWRPVRSRRNRRKLAAHPTQPAAENRPRRRKRDIGRGEAARHLACARGAMGAPARLSGTFAARFGRADSNATLGNPFPNAPRTLANGRVSHATTGPGRTLGIHTHPKKRVLAASIRGNGKPHVRSDTGKGTIWSWTTGAPWTPRHALAREPTGRRQALERSFKRLMDPQEHGAWTGPEIDPDRPGGLPPLCQISLRCAPRKAVLR